MNGVQWAEVARCLQTRNRKFFEQVSVLLPGSSPIIHHSLLYLSSVSQLIFHFSHTLQSLLKNALKNIYYLASKKFSQFLIGKQKDERVNVFLHRDIQYFLTKTSDTFCLKTFSRKIVRFSLYLFIFLISKPHPCLF